MTGMTVRTVLSRMSEDDDHDVDVVVEPVSPEEAILRIIEGAEDAFATTIDALARIAAVIDSHEEETPISSEVVRKIAGAISVVLSLQETAREMRRIHGPDA